MNAIANFAIWVLSVFAIPVVLVFLGHNFSAVYSLISGLLTSSVMFGLFCPYVNSLIRQIPQGDLCEEEEKEPPHDLDTEEVWEEWENRIYALQFPITPEDMLLSEYRKAFLALWDLVDPHFSERLAQDPISEILRLGNRSRKFSFRRFCLQLGK